MAGAAGQQACALGQGVGDVLLDLLHRLFVDQGADLHAVVEAVSDPQRLRRLRQLGDELVMDGGLHIEAVGADAGLARVAVLRGHGARHGRVHIGVVEDQEGRVAAQLQTHLLDGVRRLLHQQTADLGRAGEADLAHRLIGRQFAADGRGRAGDDVEQAGRQARLFRQNGQGQGRERRLAGGLQHHGAAGGQGRADLAGDHGGGEVPRRDRAHHPDRLAQRHQPF